MPSTSAFIFQNDNLLLQKHAQGLKLPETSSLQSHFICQYEIGVFNHTNCYCAEIDINVQIPEEFQAMPPRKSFEILGKDWFPAIAKSISIINWDKNHQFCGRCGEKTIYKPGSFERFCNHCGLSFYPRLSPSIIVLIKNEDKLLMSRSPHFAPGAYGLIAGFVEAGESLEDAVHREVKEEVGIHIKNLQYFGSQFWPFPDSLMAGFIAEYASGELMVDTKELESAGWYRYDELPGGPSTSLSISRRLIDYFVAEQKGKTNGTL